jgi:signal peptidase I
MRSRTLCRAYELVVAIASIGVVGVTVVWIRADQPFVGALIVFALVCGSAPMVLEAAARAARPTSPVLDGHASFTTVVRLGSEPDEIARASIILAARVGPTAVIATQPKSFLDEVAPLCVSVHVAGTMELALREAAGAIGTETILIVSASAFPLLDARTVSTLLHDEIGWATGRVSSPDAGRYAPLEREWLAERLRSDARAAGATLWEPDATLIRADLVAAFPIDGTRPWGHWLRELERRGFRGVDIPKPIAVRIAPTDAPVFWPSQVMRTCAAAADLADGIRQGPGRARLLVAAGTMRELFAWSAAVWAIIPLAIGWSGSFPLTCRPGTFLATVGIAAAGRWSAARLVHRVPLHPIHDARAAAYNSPGSLLALRSAASGRIQPRRMYIPAQPLLWFAVSFSLVTSVLLLDRAATSDAGANIAAGAAVANLALLWTFALRAIGKRGWDRKQYRIRVDIPSRLGGRPTGITDASPSGCAIVGQLDGIAIGSQVGIVVEFPDRPKINLRGRVEHRRRNHTSVVLGLSLDLDPRHRIMWIEGIFDAAQTAQTARPRQPLERDATRLRAPRPIRANLVFGMEMIVISAISVLAAAVLTLVLIGFRPLIITSGSMRPTLHVGDVVITSWTPAHALDVGDIVSFDDPSGARALITHRVRSMTAETGELQIETRGDANTVSEIWVVPRDTLLRRTIWDIPEVGGVVSGLGASPIRDGMLAGSAAIAATLIGVAARKTRRSATLDRAHVSCGRAPA